MQVTFGIDVSKSNSTVCELIGEMIQKLKESKGTCHLMGLMSPGGVHSHQKHIEAMCEILNKNNIPVNVHAFLDGRDTPPQSAKEFCSGE